MIPLLHRADVMVCDTSSILLMFLQLNKPVVTFKNNAPGKHLLDIDDPQRLEQHIELALSRPESLMNEIEQFNHQVHPYTDGQSSQRVLEAVNEALDKRQHLKSKPLNLLRDFKARKKLKYWNVWSQLFS